MDQVLEYRPIKTPMLIVDDDSDLRMTLCEYMGTRRFSVTPAKNGAEAIRLLQAGFHFDIIFTDMMMPPGPDGLEVLRAAKATQPKAYVVVMTGYSSIETAIESIRFGAFDFLPKPFKLAQIEIVANRILEHLTLLEDNRRLSRKVVSLSEKSVAIDSRLGKIESMLGKLTSNLQETSKH